MSYSKCVLLLMPLCASHLAGQEMGKRTSFVSGELSYETNASGQPPLDRYGLELRVRGNAFEIHRTTVTWDGNFEFRNVPEGMYELLVTDKLGTVIKSEIVTVSGFGGTAGVRIKVPVTATPTAAPVSMKRLTHKPPKPARKAFDQAAKAQKKGDVALWEEKLQEAVRLDPEFFEARINLGAFFLRANRAKEAIEHFRAALAVDSNSAVALNNLSASLLALKEHKQAEQAARQALRVEPNSPQGHYLLGIALVQQNHFTDEAADHLQASVETFPKAEQAAAFVRERMRRQAEE